jgi:hypothetical protein
MMKLSSEFTDGHHSLFDKLDMELMLSQLLNGHMPTYFKTAPLLLYFNFGVLFNSNEILNTVLAIKESLTTVDIDFISHPCEKTMFKHRFVNFDFDHEITKVIPNFFKKNSSTPVNGKKLLIFECARQIDQNIYKTSLNEKLATEFTKVLASIIINEFPDDIFSLPNKSIKKPTPTDDLKYHYLKLQYTLRNKQYNELTAKANSLLSTVNSQANFLISQGLSEFNYISLLHPNGLESIKDDYIMGSIHKISNKLVAIEKKCIEDFGLYIVFRPQNYTSEKILKRILNKKFSFFEVTLPPFPLITPFKEKETLKTIEYLTTELNESHLHYFQQKNFQKKVTINDEWISKFNSLLSVYIYEKDKAAIQTGELDNNLSPFRRSQEELAKHIRSPIIRNIHGDTTNIIAGLVLYDIKQELLNNQQSYGNEKIVDIFYERFKNDVLKAKHSPGAAFSDRDHLVRHLKHAERCVEACTALPLTGRSN